MEIWFIENERILSRERRAIDKLKNEAEWLSGLSWKVIDGLLHIEAIIQIDNYNYSVLLCYPALFPDVPAWIKPKDPGEKRWSEHQYGQSGTLCLEWGQDNWHSGLTGADLLKSAFKLLDIEKPHNKKEGQPVLSRHKLSIGQELRDKDFRIYLSRNFKEYIKSQTALKTAKASFVCGYKNNYFRVFLKNILSEDAGEWNETFLPQNIEDEMDGLRKGIIYRTNSQASDIENIKTLRQLEEFLKINEFANTPLAHKGSEELIGLLPNENLKIILIIDRDNKPHSFAFFENEEQVKLINLESVVSPYESEDKRIPEEYKILNKKLVGIVGLGSMGSKVAITLARMGVFSFYLIDDDIFLSENICRNALNWRNVAEHKVDSVAFELKLINSNISVDVSKANITEQESGSSLNGIFNKLGKCDLIIDATGNSRVFNLLSSASKKYGKSLVWGEIYEGGIGGLIARSIPGKNPEPQLMRMAYDSVTSTAPEFKSKAIRNYETEDVDGSIISVSDAHAGIIAHELAYLAVDTLLYPAPSNFPYSMYLIGLKKAWIFNQPFEVHPIDTESKFKLEKPLGKKSMSKINKEFLKKIINNK